MAASCVYLPVDKNNKPYKAILEYRRVFGRSVGKRAFLKALSPSFQERNWGQLVIDEQGVATLESAIKTKDMQNFVGFENTKNVLEKQNNFNEIPNTAENVRKLLNEAKTFNDNNSDFVVYPEVTPNGIKNTVHKRNADTIKAFNDRYGSMVLNDRLLEIFAPLGVTIEELTAAENGYSGVVDFSNAKEVAGQFVGLIKIANGLEGQMAMSEEVAHLVVRMMKNNPLMQRVLNSLVQNSGQMQQILGDDFSLYVRESTDEDGNVNYNAVAEECAGRLLQRSMLNTVQEEESGFFKTLWDRLIKAIKNVFKQFKAEDINQAVLDADQTMDTVAKKLLAGDIGFTKEDIKNTFSKDRLYHLEAGIAGLDKVIEDAIDVEIKKQKIIKNEAAKERAEKKEANLDAITSETPEGKLKGLINYAHAALIDLSIAWESLGKSKPGERNFAALLGIRSTIQSYNNFIEQLNELSNSEDEELRKLIAETKIEDKDHVEHTFRDVHNELSALYGRIKNKFKQIALDSVEEFFSPFFTEDGKIIDRTGRETTLRQLIEEANGDIGFVDKYLMTMSSSSDVLLQLFDEVVKKAKANARYDTIKDIEDILKVMLNAQDKGITSFEWLYEHTSDGKKTGNYISKVNIGQFEKDRKEFYESLDKEYGKNPTGVAAKEKIKRKREWMKAHSVLFGSRPDPRAYHNTAFDNLTSAQKEILEQFMALKQKFDKRLPANKVSTTRAIQMRRTSQQRLINTITNPTQIFKNIAEGIAKDFTKTSDDDAIYGEKTGLRSFDGTEFKVLPALYTHRLSNPEELTTDVFSALAAYSYSTNTYKEMDKVVDPLEVAKGWVLDYRKTKEVSNKKILVEKLAGKAIPITKQGGTNFEFKLQSFMDSQVYMRYYADNDKTLNVLGREVKAGKIANKWMSISSTVQLGFNALAHLANAATGLCMQNIEAFAGQYFSANELRKADGAYVAALIPFMAELESKNPTNKLALFDQMFDIKQEFAGNIKTRMNTLFEKLFGRSIAFLGQTCGDHWLYNRTAIAMCKRKKVRLRNGTVTTLWDALTVESVEGEERIKRLTIDAVDAETGEEIDNEYIRKYSEKINEINHRLFGVYNTDDMVAAQRVAMGRAVLQYRQWIVPMFARRFQDRRYVKALDEYEEGYYRTALTLLAGLRGGIEGLKRTWNDFDEGQQRNIYRAITEMIQFMAVALIANFVSFGKDDPDRIWALKLAEYMAQRELHELGNLTPSFTMGKEILKTIKSPASILNTTQSALNLCESLVNPWDWNDTIESGKYEGMSTLHKNILKAPFPILSPFNQLDRFINNIEETTRYYARSY